GSGTGKSTILKLIIGLIKPDCGEVWFENRELTCLPEWSIAQIRPRIGYVIRWSAELTSLKKKSPTAFTKDSRASRSKAPEACFPASSPEEWSSAPAW